MNESPRSFLAVLCFVAAGFIATNRAVQAAPAEEWWLALALLIAGLFLALWRSQPAVSPSTELTPADGMRLTGVRAAPSSAAPAQPDDLIIIEGIGPKFAAALNAAGITTFARLASASTDELQAAIRAAGMRFAPSLPTWAEQAAYAARGDWDGLTAFQATLTAGRRG